MMEPRSVTLGGHSYVIGRLNALDQSDLALELAAPLSRTPAVRRGKNAKADEVPIMEMLGVMPRAQRHELFALALRCVRRQTAKAASPVLVPNAEGLTLAYQDIGGSDLVRLVMEAITYNLANFTEESLSSIPEAVKD